MTARHDLQAKPVKPHNRYENPHADVCEKIREMLGPDKISEVEYIPPPHEGLGGEFVIKTQIGVFSREGLEVLGFNHDVAIGMPTYNMHRFVVPAQEIQAAFPDGQTMGTTQLTYAIRSILTEANKLDKYMDVAQIPQMEGDPYIVRLSPGTPPPWIEAEEQRGAKDKFIVISELELRKVAPQLFNTPAAAITA